MKYTTEIEIRLPREEVLKKLYNPNNLKHWQKGFVSKEHLNGEPGEEGAESRLIYKMGKREIEMTETITKKELPLKLSASYNAKGVYNIQKNIFEETPRNHTMWTSRNKFEFSGFMKLMGWLMPGAFKKQTYQYMQDFKKFAETGKSLY
ncbi:SRPBCC family protein [Salegentibacter chungangensis]|uniref:SRPBCC family protein n=1 Tax=Salegentibacter chungangensis TaxID=1335724 RepID=A0ABW3NTV5_9FLAO